MKRLSMYECLEHNSSATAEPATHSEEYKKFASVTAIPATEETHNDDAKQHQANVTEIIIARAKTDGLQMVLPMLTRLSQEKRWLAWIDPPVDVLRNWHQQNNVASDEIMVLRSDAQHSALALSKKALSAGTCHAVIMWTEQLSSEEFEELEHASSQGNSHGIVLRSR